MAETQNHKVVDGCATCPFQNKGPHRCAYPTDDVDVKDIDTNTEFFPEKCPLVHKGAVMVFSRLICSKGQQALIKCLTAFLQNKVEVSPKHKKCFDNISIIRWTKCKKNSMPPNGVPILVVDTKLGIGFGSYHCLYNDGTPHPKPWWRWRDMGDGRAYNVICWAYLPTITTINIKDYI